MKVFLSHFQTVYFSQAQPVPGWNIDAHFDFDMYLHRHRSLFYPLHELIKRARLSDLQVAQLRERPAKTVFILASGNAHFAGLASLRGGSEGIDYQFTQLPLTLSQIVAHRESVRYGPMARIQTDASACASSLLVLENVLQWLSEGIYDRAIVLSVEDPVTNTGLRFFTDCNAFSDTKPSAFDSVHFGFLLGQAAVTGVLENENAQSGPPWAQLHAVAVASEDHANPLGMRADGQGYRQVIELLKPQEYGVGIVKTHGTGTLLNNLAERAALEQTLIGEWIATSFKPTIGHTMGPSGLLETCLLFEQMRASGTVPPILNRFHEDERFISKTTVASSPMVLSLAAGMGNIFAGTIMEYIAI